MVNFYITVPKVEAMLCMYGSAPCAAIGVNKILFKN